MVKIFSYEKLHDLKEQQDTFGILFHVDPDFVLLKGWDFINRESGGEDYRIATPRGQYDIIMGNMVHIPDDYMEIIDDYMGYWYKRVPIKTMNGIDCEIYAKNY